MSYDIEVRTLAAVEILEAYDWYEEQRIRLGSEFLEDLDKFYELIQRDPLMFSYYDKPVRDGKLSRFPYTIAYEITENILVIYSVFMFKQSPGKKRTK